MVNIYIYIEISTYVYKFIYMYMNKHASINTTGALDEDNPEHLKVELEELKEKVEKNSPLWRVTFGDRYTGFLCFQDFKDVLEYEKTNHKVPGKSEAKLDGILAVDNETTSTGGGAKETAPAGGSTNSTAV